MKIVFEAPQIFTLAVVHNFVIRKNKIVSGDSLELSLIFFTKNYSQKCE
nr:MAG TPA: hypothetical protein [Caudoviricetes sp.]